MLLFYEFVKADVVRFVSCAFRTCAPPPDQRSLLFSFFCVKEVYDGEAL